MELQAEAERKKRAQVGICLLHIESLASFVRTTYQPVKHALLNLTYICTCKH